MQNTREIAEQYRLSHWAEVMSRRQASGQSIKGFCRTEEIHQNVYYYWQRKLREAACERLPELQTETTGKSLTCPSSAGYVPGFAEVRLDEASVPQIASAPPRAVSPEAVPSQITLEINGIKIITDSTYPADKLAALCRELSC